MNKVINTINVETDGVDSKINEGLAMTLSKGCAVNKVSEPMFKYLWDFYSVALTAVQSKHGNLNGEPINFYTRKALYSL